MIHLKKSYCNNNKKPKKVGVIGLRHEVNIGNNLIKYAIFIKLSEFGFIPYIIGTHLRKHDITFLKKNTNCIIINNSFSEIKKKDYDILMVNSDQTWRKFDRNYYDYGFLNFSKNWNIPKFIYGASLGYSNWPFSEKDDKVFKELLKNFTGVSVRENGSILLINKHLGIKPLFVLDPTLLINKNYYIELIKSTKIGNLLNINYIFVYIIKKKKIYSNYIENASRKLNYKIYKVKMREKNSIEKFIYGIVNSRAVITDSYHGTIFSIIFNKPFISFIRNAKERYNSLKYIFNISNRLFETNQIPNFNLLYTPLNLNYTLMNSIKNNSIDYLKKNLKVVLL